MKIALIITGQLRTYQTTRNKLKHAILDKYDTDIFLSINRTDHQNAQETLDIQDAVQFYNPRGHIVCEPYGKIYERDRLRLNEDTTMHLPNETYRNILEQFYVVKQGYRLVTEYIEKTKIEYDVVIRTRFDTFLYTGDNTDNTNIDIHCPLYDEIGVTGFSINGNLSWADDHIWIHSQRRIQLFYSYYDELFLIINKLSSDGTQFECGPYHEIFFYRFLQSHQLRPIPHGSRVFLCR